MANTRSARKSIRLQERRRLRNAAVRSAVRTLQKESLSKIEAKSGDAQAAALQAIRQIDKALAKGIVPRRSAARKKSRLMRKLNLITNANA